MSYYCQSGFGKKINNLDEINSLSAIQFCACCLDVVYAQKFLNIFGTFFAASLYHFAAASAATVDAGIYLLCGCAEVNFPAADYIPLPCFIAAGEHSRKAAALCHCAVYELAQGRLVQNRVEDNYIAV